MPKYNVYVRRTPNDDWSAWCNTDQKEVFETAIHTIESYGYEWTSDCLMAKRDFTAMCLAYGIGMSEIKGYAKGRIHFTTKDIENLRRGAK